MKEKSLHHHDLPALLPLQSKAICKPWSFCHRNQCISDHYWTPWLRSSQRNPKSPSLVQVFQQFQDRNSTDCKSKLCFRCFQKLECYPYRKMKWLNACWTWYTFWWNCWPSRFDRKYFYWLWPEYRFPRQFSCCWQFLKFYTELQLLQSIIIHNATTKFQVLIVLSWDPLTNSFLGWMIAKLEILFSWPVNCLTIYPLSIFHSMMVPSS